MEQWAAAEAAGFSWDTAQAVADKRFTCPLHKQGSTAAHTFQAGLSKEILRRKGQAGNTFLQGLVADIAAARKR